jgi:hypothetical protein
MIIIAIFPSLNEAQSKLDDYNDLARSPSSGPDFNLTDIYKHQTVELWWFSATDCIENGGLNKQAIAEDVDTLDTLEFNTRQDLIDNGYLPPPEDLDD